MKLIVCFACFFFLFCEAAEIRNECKNTADCGEGERCVRIHPLISRCKLGQEIEMERGKESSMDVVSVIAPNTLQSQQILENDRDKSKEPASKNYEREDIYKEHATRFTGDTVISNRRLVYKGDVIIDNGEFIVSNNIDVTVHQGNLVLTRGNFIPSNTDVTIHNGDLVLERGNFIFSNGRATINQGDVIMKNGDITLNNAVLQINDGELKINGRVIRNNGEVIINN